MKVLFPGSDYMLDSFNHTVEQRLFFVRGVRMSNGPLRVEKDGATNEEVFAVLIHRLNHLQLQKPCKETAMAITKLEEAQLWLNARKAAPGEEG
jgi:hypothetical protein